MSSSETVGHKRPFEDDSIPTKRPRHENSNESSLDHSMLHDPILDHTTQPELFLSSHSSASSTEDLITQSLPDVFHNDHVTAVQPSYRTIPRALLDSDLYAPDVNELIDLQNEADIDIEALRRAMAEQDYLEEDDDDEDHQSAAQSSDDEVDSDVDLEDEIDENDLPRLKDLQQAGLISYSQSINRAINQMIYSRNNLDENEFESDDDDDESDAGSINHTTNPPHEIHINGSNGISPFDLPALANSSLSLPVVTPVIPAEPVHEPVERNTASASESSESSSELSNPFILPSQPIDPFQPSIQPVEPIEPLILKSSRVGDAYQATNIPHVLSYEEKVIDESMMQIYDGEKVELEGIGAPPVDSIYQTLKDRQMNNQINHSVTLPAHVPNPVLNNQFEAPAVISARRPRASAQRARESIAETIANEQINPPTVTVYETINESIERPIETELNHAE